MGKTPINKYFIRAIISTIGKDTLLDGLHQLIDTVKKEKSNFQLKEGEREVISFQYEKDDIIYNALGVVDQDNKIVRIENPQPIDQFILNYLNEL